MVNKGVTRMPGPGDATDVKQQQERAAGCEREASRATHTFLTSEIIISPILP
ncbi:hypothetical protein NQZ68_000884 [Dissostichus eleginoides]|nr:hypothetical protein NQZ68_000884 [Dissostichus eleginoides]